MEMVKIERQIFVDLTLAYMNGFVTELAIAYVQVYIATEVPVKHAYSDYACVKG